MRFRRVALFAALASFVSLAQGAISFYVVAKITWHNRDGLSHVTQSFELLIPLMLALFFSLLYCEASELIKGEIRATIALVLLVLMVLDASGRLLNLALEIFTRTHYHIDTDISVLCMRGFELVRAVFFIAFLVAFSSRKGAITSKFTARVAGALALLTLCSSVWTGVQLHRAWTVYSHLSLAWNSAALVFWYVAMLLFFAVIWGTWKRDLPVHENIIC